MTFELDFDTKGQPVSASQLARLIAESKRVGATDLIFLAHGFRCAQSDATTLYTNLLATLLPNLAAMTKRTFAIAGVYWPSQEFRETCGNDVPPAKFVESILAKFGDGNDDPAEGLPLLHEFTGAELLHKLQSPLVDQPAREGGALSLPLADPVHEAIDKFLNFMSWVAMKKLSGEVGANGVAAAVRACQNELPAARIHLAGHSLGGRLMSACCKSLGRQQAPKIDSLSLLEAAFSHFGFSPDAGWGQPGFFRDVIAAQTVRGPIISTFSKLDSVVGTVYALASRLAHDRLQAIGDSADPYGGIGHNGAQRTPESIAIRLHRQGQPYQLRPGMITCLDGSAGLITGHGDVTNPHVTYAVASAICTAA
jgi:hypothetical protein